jgi:hypothetical protein
LACCYLNPFYVNHKECDIYELKEMPSMKQLRIWGGFFFKKFRAQNPDYKFFHRYNELYIDHFRNKREADELRKELLLRHKDIHERKARLAELKALE